MRVVPDGMTAADEEFDDSSFPPRPALPILLFLALGMWISSAAGLRLVSEWTNEANRILIILGCMSALVALLVFVRKPRSCTLLLIGLCVGLVLVGITGCMFHAAQQQVLGKRAHYELQLTQDAAPSANAQGGFSVQCRIVKGGPMGALVRLYYKEGDPLLCGSRISVTGTIKEPGEQAAESAWNRGEVGVLSASTITVLPLAGFEEALYSLRASGIEALQSERCSEGSLLLQAMLLGYRPDLYGSDLYQSVKVDGLAHLVAVSGAHLVIVCSMGYLVLRRLPLARGIILALQLTLLVGYLALTGFPISAIRAAIMTCIALFSFVLKRRSYSLNAIAVCAIVMVAQDPRAVYSLSFFLSVVSTLGIVLYSGWISWHLRTFFEGIPSMIEQGISLTFASMLLAGCYIASEFGQCSLIAPLANCVAGPIFTGLCTVGVPLALLASTGLPGTGVCMEALLGSAQAFCAVLHGLASVPFAAVPVSLDPLGAAGLTISAAVLLWVVWPKVSKRKFLLSVSAFGVALCVFGIVGAVFQPTRLIMLDVGQGDALVMQSGGRTVLVDTGCNDAMLLKGLGRYGITHLDAVCITHPDNDHIGSLDALIGYVSADAVFCAAPLIDLEDASMESLDHDAVRLSGASLQGLQVGDIVTFGSMSAEVVAPSKLTDEGGNGDSLVLLVRIDVDGDSREDWTCLLTGDAEADELHALIDRRGIGDIDVLKVGHHGSKVSLDEEILTVLRPELALVSVGERNTYGHPAPSILTLLDTVGCSVWRTDQQGDIACTFDLTEISVKALG